jgi:hypothetical protein
MSFRLDPEKLSYKQVMDLLRGLKEQAYNELLTLEAKDGFPSPKDKEQFCYWAGEQEAINKALFYVWDMGQRTSYEEFIAIPTLETKLDELRKSMGEAGVIVCYTMKAAEK